MILLEYHKSYGYHKLNRALDRVLYRTTSNAVLDASPNFLLEHFSVVKIPLIVCLQNEKLSIVW